VHSTDSHTLYIRLLLLQEFLNPPSPVSSLFIQKCICLDIHSLYVWIVPAVYLF
jgi:hypothetical protein